MRLWLLVVLVVGVDAGVCQRNWKFFAETGQCYIYLNLDRSSRSPDKTLAKQCANFLNATIAVPRTAEENMFIHNTAPGRGRGVWLPMTYAEEEGTWRWHDGSTVDYFNWNRYKPEGRGHCAWMDSSGRWSDEVCDLGWLFPVVCTKPATYVQLPSSTIPSSSTGRTSHHYGYNNLITSAAEKEPTTRLSAITPTTLTSSKTTHPFNFFPGYRYRTRDHQQRRLGMVAGHGTRRTEDLRSYYRTLPRLEATTARQPRPTPRLYTGNYNAATRAPTCTDLLTNCNARLCTAHYAELAEVMCRNTCGLCGAVRESAKCDQGWTQNTETGQCYRLFDHKVDYPTAAAECQRKSARLAMPKTEAENNFLHKMILDSKLLQRQFDAVWLPLTEDRVTHLWSWADGTKLEWTKWAPGQPNQEYQNCVWMEKSGEWYDYYCKDGEPRYQLQRYICTKPPHKDIQSYYRTLPRLEATTARQPRTTPRLYTGTYYDIRSYYRTLPRLEATTARQPRPPPRLYTGKYDAVQGAGECDQGWTQNTENGQCYRLFDHKIDYPTAVAECQRKSARLAMPKTEAENNFLFRMIFDSKLLQRHTFDGVWLPLTEDRVTHLWSWDDGTKAEWTKWAPGEPNREYENCAWMDKAGEWWDYHCKDGEPRNQLQRYICTKPSHTGGHKNRELSTQKDNNMSNEFVSAADSGHTVNIATAFGVSCVVVLVVVVLVTVVVCRRRRAHRVIGKSDIAGQVLYLAVEEGDGKLRDTGNTENMVVANIYHI